MVFCSNCGTEALPADLFCSECGTRIQHETHHGAPPSSSTSPSIQITASHGSYSPPTAPPTAPPTTISPRGHAGGAGPMGRTSPTAPLKYSRSAPARPSALPRGRPSHRGGGRGPPSPRRSGPTSSRRGGGPRSPTNPRGGPRRAANSGGAPQRSTPHPGDSYSTPHMPEYAKSMDTSPSSPPGLRSWKQKHQSHQENSPDFAYTRKQENGLVPDYKSQSPPPTGSSHSPAPVVTMGKNFAGAVGAGAGAMLSMSKEEAGNNTDMAKEKLAQGASHSKGLAIGFGKAGINVMKGMALSKEEKQKRKKQMMKQQLRKKVPSDRMSH